MGACCQGCRKTWKSKGTWSWGVLGSVVFHGLLVAAVVVAFQERPTKPKVVVPVETLSLVPFKTGPRGGGGGRPAPVTTPQSPTMKPSLPPPPPKSPARPLNPPKAKLVPLAETTSAPTIPTPALPPAATRTKASDPAITSSRAGIPGARAASSGTGQGGQGGGRGTGSGGGMGQGEGPGSGAGSALQGYLRAVRQLLEKHKNYPHMARRRHLQGIVVLVFTISSGGQIESSRVGRASGHDLLDEAAQDTIRRVVRFPPFPAELNRQKLTIEIPLAFRLGND